jgi:WD40 repeat protein/serine/threonine protein kinase
MSDPSSARDPVEELAEEFAARYRRGEHPSLSEYTNKYPQLAEQIRELFPAMVVMEHFGSVAGPPTGPFEPRAEDTRELPERLGDYRILREVGRGGMGVVYEAVQESLGRHVALKILPFHRLMDSTHLERFRREARAAAQLHHTNIVPVFGVGVAEGIHYYAMQFIQGQGLDAVLEVVLRLRQRKGGGRIEDKEPASALSVSIAQGLLTGQFHEAPASAGHVFAAPEVVGIPSSLSRPSKACPSASCGGGAERGTSDAHSELASQTEAQYCRSVAQVGVQVADALAYAHKQRILHRDIKPSNLLLDTQGTVWITDFGLAKAEGSEELTSPGDIVGTVRFMAPERFQGRGDPRSDLYSLGITLYEMLTLRPAFADSHRARLLERVTQEMPARPRKLDPHIPPDLDTIVMKAIAKEPADRYPTAEDLAEDLRRFLNGRPIQARPAGPVERLWRWSKRNPMVAGLTGAIFVLLAAVAGVASIGYVGEAAERAEADRQRTAAERQREEADRQRAAAQTAEQEMRRQVYAANLSLMQQAWDNNRVVPLRALLAETEAYPDRGFEWYYWQRLCHRELKTLIGHRAQVTGVCWSPDGEQLATASWDQTAKVWEASSGRVLVTLSGHTGAVHSVSWSPDGKRLATVSLTGIAKLWDATNGRLLLTLEAHKGFGFCVSWSPDGKLLATGGVDGTAKVWNVATGRELLNLAGHEGGAISLSWSPDGRRLATGARGDGTARVWDAARGRELLTLKGPTGRSVAFSPDGKALLTGGKDGIAKVWDSSDGRELFALEGPPGWVVSVSWSSDGRRLATAYEDGTTKIWEAGGKRELATFKGHRAAFASVSWSPGGNRLATASFDGTAKIWDCDHDPALVTFQAHSSGVTALSWSSDGKHLATASKHGPAKVWNAAEGRQLLTVKGLTDGIDSVSWSPDGKRLATGSFDGTAKVYEVTSGRELLTLKGRGISWSPDGTQLATVSENGTAKIWDSRDGRPIHILKGHHSAVTSVCWSTDGKQLATGSVDGTAIVWDAAVGKSLLPIKQYTSGVRCVAWSPDGNRLATGNDDGTANVWNLAGGGRVLPFRGLSSRGAQVSHEMTQISSVCWSPDGKRLATGSGDGTTKIWDAASGQELLTLAGGMVFHLQGTKVMSWSQDGKRLATGSFAGTVKVWEAADAEAVQEWGRQDRALERTLARNALRGGEEQGFIQNWLLLLPLPLSQGENGAQALDRQQLADEAQLRPRVGQRVITPDGREWVWREHHSAGAIRNFNAVLGRMTEKSIAYAVCYLESDRPRDDLRLQVGSDDQGKVYLNGAAIYECRQGRSLNVLDTVGSVRLKKGINTLVFKVVNETTDWEGCVRLVDAAGRPAEGIHVKLTAEP